MLSWMKHSLQNQTYNYAVTLYSHTKKNKQYKYSHWTMLEYKKMFT